MPTVQLDDVAIHCEVAGEGKVERLILNCAGSPFAGALRVAFEFFAEMPEHEGMAAVWAHQRFQAALPRLIKENRDLQESFKAGFLAARPRSYAAAIGALISMQDPIPRASEIRRPTLVVTGEEDPNFPFAEAFAARVPTATKVVIPGAGHYPQLETPDAFNEAVRRFLTAGASGAPGS